jgi:hypothetical protein
MTTTETLTALITMGVFMFGSILALIWYLGHVIDRSHDQLAEAIGHLAGRLDHLDEVIQALREDVAVLKATR